MYTFTQTHVRCKTIYCAVTKYLLETNGYNPQAQVNIKNTKADNASLWTGPNTKKKTNMYKMYVINADSCNTLLTEENGRKKIPSTLQR